MKNYCVISHTHWDREWYLPFENFRMRLVDLMDNLLELLEQDEGYRFHMDAQTIVLEDYLAIRPYQREKIEKFVREGRLLIGPWYVQNDFHLCSGEATVRNLLVGKKIAEEFGKCTMVGYAADQFGLCSQLPQMMVRFGLDSCIFGRGFSRGETQFYWQSEDGSRLLCEWMHEWYNNAQRFSADPEKALALLKMRSESCARMGKTGDALLMNGVDHLEAQEDLSEVIEKVQPLLASDEKFFQDTMPEYMERMKKTIEERGLKLNTYTGELRDLGQPKVLTGTLASRIYLKQYNAKLQALLERKFEPLYTTAAALGVCDYPHDYSEYMWKTLIENHPHDSICGCSVDPVHAHMVDRFIRVDENVTDLIDRGTASMMEHLDRTGLNNSQYLIMNTNNTPLEYNGVMEATVIIPADEDTGAFVLTDRAGHEIPFEVVRMEKNVNERILSPINLPGTKVVDRYTIRYRLKLAGMSYRVLTLTPEPGTLMVEQTRHKSAYQMENEFLKVRINRNGTLDLTDKKTGKTHEGMLLLEDSADIGNAYVYRDAEESSTLTSNDARARVSVVEDTPLLQSRSISLRVKIDRKEGAGYVDVEFTVSLGKGDRALSVDVRMDNQCKCHRLRVLIPTGIANEVNYAGQPYDIIARNRVSQFANDKTHPNTEFVGIDGEGYGFAVLNRGLYEYEHMMHPITGEPGTLALTLLRAVYCFTSGTDSVGGSGTYNLTPEGQCLGEQTCSLSLYPYAGDHVTAEVAARAAQFTCKPYAAVQGVDCNKLIGGRPFVQAPGMTDLFYRPIKNADVVLPHDHKLFTLEDENKAMVLTACKAAFNRDGSFIIRLYNTTSEQVNFALKLFRAPKSVCEVDLGENTVADLRAVRGKVELSAAPKQIVTIKVNF